MREPRMTTFSKIGSLVAVSLLAGCATFGTGYQLANAPASVDGEPTICVGAPASRISSRHGVGATCRDNVALVDYL